MRDSLLSRPLRHPFWLSEMLHVPFSMGIAHRYYMPAVKGFLLSIQRFFIHP